MSADNCCAHCGKQGVEFKRCSTCKQTWYCGAKCQKAGWKGHKKTCEPPLPLDDVREILAAGDWREVLKCEGRMEALLEYQMEDVRERVLGAYIRAHSAVIAASYNRDENARSAVRLQIRHVELLGKMQRFRDQGEAMCDISRSAHAVGTSNPQEEGKWCQEEVKSSGRGKSQKRTAFSASSSERETFNPAPFTLRLPPYTLNSTPY
jgi:hypothetical protein